jgi:prepilin-type N-terminal cleavage/methylation domain-containing protein
MAWGSFMRDQSSPEIQLPAKPRGRERGFTMIELLVVVAIIGALAAIAIPAYFSYVNKAKLTVAINTMSTIRKTLEAFNIDYGEFPEPPINFATGLDNLGRTVFPPILRENIDNDLQSIDSYTLAGADYTVIATAKDSANTVLTLTPQNLDY